VRPNESYLYLEHASFPRPCEVVVVVVVIAIIPIFTIFTIMVVMIATTLTIPVPSISINSNSLTSYCLTGIINEGTDGDAQSINLGYTQAASNSGAVTALFARTWSFPELGLVGVDWRKLGGGGIWLQVGCFPFTSGYHV